MSTKNLFKKVAQASFSALLPYGSFSSFIARLAQSEAFRFVTVVYDDFQGIRRPIGLIHLVLVQGEMREVLTYCCHGRRQPGMAVMVKARTGNLTEQIALSVEEQDLIPAWLKCLPEEYRTPYLDERSAGLCMA